MLTLSNSADVNRPHVPSDILFRFPQGLMRYWHIGSKRKAKATVAITAVHIANNICMESKKKNITNNEIDAPKGKHIACNESKVCMPVVLSSVLTLFSLSLASCA